MKQILFIDFDGTLCFDKYWRSLPPAQYEQVQELIFGKDKTRLNDWMLGKYSAEAINKIVADSIGRTYTDVWSLFVNDCKTMNVSVETLEKISSLRERYVTILVTGNMDSFSRFTVPSLHLNTYFDHINNSFFERRHKTDEQGSIFTEYAESLHSSIEKCILIDNSEKICECFSKLGGTACLITSEHNINSYLAQL